MVNSRKPYGLILVVLLAGCDKPEKEPSEKPAKPQAAAVESVAPKPIAPAASHAKPITGANRHDEPILTSRVPEKLGEKPKPAPVPDKKPELVIEKPKPKTVHKTVKAKLPEPDEPLKVDLSIPKELVESTVPVTTAKGVEPDTKLPPLFKEQDDGRFNLSGRILNQEGSDDFDGAELQFQFKR
jgi:hypothetical protein